MQFLWKNNYWLVMAYVLLGLGIALEFYLLNYHFNILYIIAVLCTLFSVRRLHTILIGIIGLIVSFFLNYRIPEPIVPVTSQLGYYSYIIGIIVTVVIILISKKYTNESAQNLMKLESLFNYATIGIIVTNKEGKICNFNRYAEVQFGYTEREVLAQNIEILIPSNLHGIHKKHREKFYQHLQPRIMGAGRDLHARKKDGNDFPVEVSLSYYQIINQVYVIAFVVDISVRKQNEQLVLQQKEVLERTTIRITQNNQELESKVESRTQMLKETLTELEKSQQELSNALEKEKELGDLKSRFVTMASHEFRTPLSTILSSADILEQYNIAGDKNGKVDKQIQRIKYTVAGMKTILEDFLSLGKLEEGTVHANIEIIDFNDCVEEIKLTIQEMQQIAKVGQVITFVYTGEGKVYIDMAFVQNILTNLLSNAIKFSPEQATINVLCQLNKDTLTLIVKDRGIGISQEDQQHLFERFFRAHNATTIQGTGLGLHIIARYVELLKGKIEMQSGINEGTTFVIRIPKSGN